VVNGALKRFAFTAPIDFKRVYNKTQNHKLFKCSNRTLRMATKKTISKEEDDKEIVVEKEIEVKEKKESSAKSTAPSWVKMKPAELEKIIVELGRKGENPSKIGLILRDTHGVPKAKLLGKKIVQILKENKVQYKTEKETSEIKIGNLKSHITKNKHDYSASRSLAKELWALHKIEQLQK
jgi:small subunit ribosomal protein S15